MGVCSDSVSLQKAKELICFVVESKCIRVTDMNKQVCCFHFSLPYTLHLVLCFWVIPIEERCNPSATFHGYMIT